MMITVQTECAGPTLAIWPGSTHSVVSLPELFQLRKRPEAAHELYNPRNCLQERNLLFILILFPIRRKKRRGEEGRGGEEKKIS
jgi:hypothetical protein